MYQWGYRYNVRQTIFLLLRWKSSNRTNLLKILMIQKFSLFKDFSCRIKRYTFFQILVSRTMYPPIKSLQREMIQSNHFVTLLIVWHFTRMSVLCNLFIFASPINVTRNLVSFYLFFFLLALWSYSVKKAFSEVFLQIKNIVGTACSFSLLDSYHKFCLKARDGLQIFHHKARHKISVK